MPLYNVKYTMSVTYGLIVEANNEDEANDRARDADAGNFTADMSTHSWDYESTEALDDIAPTYPEEEYPVQELKNILALGIDPESIVYKQIEQMLDHATFAREFARTMQGFSTLDATDKENLNSLLDWRK